MLIIYSELINSKLIRIIIMKFMNLKEILKKANLMKRKTIVSLYLALAPQKAHGA